MEREPKTSQVGCFTHRGVAYFFEHVEDPEDRLLKAVYLVRGPQRATYVLLRTADDPELLFAVNVQGFSRRTPFDGVLLMVENGNLVVTPRAASNGGRGRS